MSKVEQLRQDWRSIADEFPRVVLANSLGLEDMVLLDCAAQLGLPVRVLVLETGRLHDETLTLLAQASDRYAQLDWTVTQPDPEALSQFIEIHGIDGFYNSVDARKACCQARKVKPLNRELAQADAWVTGQRQAQSSTRATLAFREHDSAHQIAKFNPLAQWSLNEVWDYIHSHQVPYNPLHDQHYPSIGCQPCTRAIAAGEDIRAGRWWWEQPEGKECGLHPIR